MSGFAADRSAPRKQRHTARVFRRAFLSATQPILGSIDCLPRRIDKANSVSSFQARLSVDQALRRGVPEASDGVALTSCEPVTVISRDNARASETMVVRVGLIGPSPRSRRTTSGRIPARLATQPLIDQAPCVGRRESGPPGQRRRYGNVRLRGPLDTPGCPQHEHRNSAAHLSVLACVKCKSR